MEGIKDKFKAFLSYKTEIFRLQNGNYSGPAEQIIDLSTQLCANIGIFPFFFYSLLGKFPQQPPAPLFPRWF